MATRRTILVHFAEGKEADHSTLKVRYEASRQFHLWIHSMRAQMQLPEKVGFSKVLTTFAKTYNSKHPRNELDPAQLHIYLGDQLVPADSTIGSVIGESEAEETHFILKPAAATAAVKVFTKGVLQGILRRSCLACNQIFN